MFTGIVEFIATLESVTTQGSNRLFTLRAPLDEPIQVDQSIAHDGVCLTVTAVLPPEGDQIRYAVTAVEETLKKSHLAQWQAGTRVNLERSMRTGARLDGHFVQGHVDTTGVVRQVDNVDGSWNYVFGFAPHFSHLLVDKGSVCINGVSLTVVEAGQDQFSVTIIPYTYEHTNFHALRPGDQVNLEFDILGKYIARIVAQQQQQQQQQ
jgi:riboflavin synthase